jgi:hypothetical protein
MHTHTYMHTHMHTLREVIDTCFVGSVSRIGGMSLADLQRESEAFWTKVCDLKGGCPGC